uniref:Uncharacterized protein LOC102809260 n=1 Tax=Saccoglossus kowalevskii TaxID=10224 RepID=A0ABM0M9S9_SACKO|nr:PREDICTED: uncharacterized protein LOC102809260 [Saccoglossus kowalevskii]
MHAKVSLVALVVFLTQSLRVIAICEVDPASEPFQVFDEMFREILGDSPTLELLHNSSEPAEFHEGPVYYSNGQSSYLLYTTQPPADYTDENVEPQITIQQYDIASDTIATFRNASLANMPNGQSKDLDGKLLTCEQGFRDTALGRITRTDMSTGEVEVVIDSYYGRKFNSPNDVVMKSDGTIWFTDPEYGYQQAFKPSPEIGNYLSYVQAVSKGWQRLQEAPSSPILMWLDRVNAASTLRDSRPNTSFPTEAAARNVARLYHI